MEWAGRDAELLRALVAGTSAQTGDAFFRNLVAELSRAFQAGWAFVTERLEVEPTRLRILAMWERDRLVDPFEYAIAGTPCSTVILEGKSMFEADASPKGFR